MPINKRKTTIIFIIQALILCVPASTLAHEGHGDESVSGFMHYSLYHSLANHSWVFIVIITLALLIFVLLKK